MLKRGLCNRICKLVLLLLMPVLPVGAQVFDNSRKVDTLSFAERFAIRTNITDWVFTVPNVGFEFDLRNKNWNRYAINVNFRYRPRTTGTYVRPLIFNIFDVAVEGRQYWRERRATSSGYLKRHRYWVDKLFSCRTMMPSHPKWIFYRGAYVAYTDYSILLGSRGRQGSAMMAGLTWGFVKPFVAFQNGTSIDMEFGISAGIAYGKYDNYTYNVEDNCYPKTGSTDWGLVKYPVVRDLHAALVYRLGNYPIQKKYRWRYDVDMPYHDRRDSLYNAWLMKREVKFIRDSIYNVVAYDFRQLYDSCVAERHKQIQADIDAKSPKRLTQDSIKLRKQFIRDSIAARKDSIAREKAIKAGKPIPANKHTETRQKVKNAQAAAEKAKAKAKAAKVSPSGGKATGGRKGDETPMTDKEAKKQMMQERAARAKANAAKAKARREEQKAAKKAPKDKTKGGTK